MARVTSLNMLLESSGKDYLAELYGKVIENVQKNCISSLIKNMDLSGDPQAGSVEAKRFANATSQAYGTARTAGKGDGVTVRPVTIPIDTDKEIVEELEQKDISLYGVDGVLDRRSANHVLAMTRELERAFYTAAATAGSSISTFTATDWAGKIEEAIVTLETVKNDFVDGVERDMISVICTPAVYSSVRTYLDANTHNANIDTSVEAFERYHGVRIFSSIYLPSSTNFIVMADGSVAQPVMPTPYAAEKVPMSNAFAVELFYSYGTAAVTPDLIFKA